MFMFTSLVCLLAFVEPAAAAAAGTPLFECANGAKDTTVVFAADSTRWVAGSTASRSTTRNPVPTIFQEEEQIPQASSPPFVAPALANSTAAKGQPAALAATGIPTTATRTLSSRLSVCNVDDEAFFMMSSEAAVQADPILLEPNAVNVFMMFPSNDLFSSKDGFENYRLRLGGPGGNEDLTDRNVIVGGALGTQKDPLYYDRLSMTMLNAGYPMKSMLEQNMNTIVAEAAQDVTRRDTAGNLTIVANPVPATPYEKLLQVNMNFGTANTKISYSEYDSVDFELTFEQRQLVPNSIRIESDLDVNSADSTPILGDGTSNIYIDPKIGAHSFISSITTELQQAGVIENFQEYPRYVRMMTEATMAENDTFNSENVCELRSPSLKVSNAIIAGQTDGQTTRQQSADFSIKPKFCLNTLSGPMSFTKSGAVRITIKLSRYFASLFGGSMNANHNYQLSNLRLCFMTMPDVSAKAKVMMRTKLNIKQSITSNFANVSTKVPAVCNAVSCSVQRQSKENSQYSNNVETEVLPNVSELQFLFNDSQNEYITYQIKDREELLRRYIQSFAETGSNSASINRLRANQGWGLGLPFRDFIDLSNQKFNVQLTCDVSSGPYILYMYFHSTSQL